MPIDLYVQPHGTFVSVVVSGTYDDPAQAGDKFADVIAACRRASVRDVLIDTRNVSGTAHETGRAIVVMLAGEHHDLHLASGGKPLRVGMCGPEGFVGDSREPTLAALAQAHGFELFGSTEIEVVRAWLGTEGGISRP